MNPILKNVLFFILAIAAGMGAMMLGHKISWMLIPPPSEINFDVPASFVEHAHKITSGGWALALLSHALGPIVSGLVIAKFVDSKHKSWVFGAGILWTVFGIMNLVSIPHPMWFKIADTCMYLPMAILGARLVRNPL